jgi:hypothetical protein
LADQLDARVLFDPPSNALRKHSAIDCQGVARRNGSLCGALEEH